MSNPMVPQIPAQQPVSIQAQQGNVVPISAASAWGTSGSRAYSEFDFHTAASDNNGASESIRAKLPPWLQRDLLAMIGDGAYPAYQSTSDVVRDALYHRVHWLKDNNATPAMRVRMAQALHDWDLEQKIIDAENAINRATNLLQRMMASLEEMEKYHLWSTMARVVDEARTDVADWEGTIGMDFNRILDEYERKIPEEYRIRD